MLMIGLGGGGCGGWGLGFCYCAGVIGVMGWASTAAFLAIVTVS